VVNEYPATSLAGETDAHFAKVVAEETAGRLVIEPVPDGKSGLKTKDQMRAVTDGKAMVANSFGGARGDEGRAILRAYRPWMPGGLTSRSERRHP